MRSDEILSSAALNRTVLARQLLLERADLDVPAALERVGGLQTQYAPSGYIGLWSRVNRFERHHLTRALEDRAAVQATAMRSTIHMVSASDHPLLIAGVREHRRTWWLRTGKGDERAARTAADRVRSLLATGPRRRDEIVGELGLEPTMWGAVELWVDLVRQPPSGTWERRRADLYALAEQWLPPSPATFDDGLDLLVHRYLAAFGPAARRDIANWTGLPVGAIRPALDRLELRRYRDGDGKELVDLPGLPIPAADVPAPVRFLGNWEAVLLVHARRASIVPERFRPLLFNTKMPQSAPTFLVDGQVAGTWAIADDHIDVTPFEPLSSRARVDVDAEAERLAAFVR